MKLGGHEVGADRPFFLIAGPCVVESEALVIEVAGRLKEITGRLGIPYVFKASYDKANRSSQASYRGPGNEQGLKPLDKVPEQMICRVLGVGRSAIWRTRLAYLEGGLEYAVHDVQRPGAPRKYETDVEAQIAALACSAPPAGAKHWTLMLLEREARSRPKMKDISRETIRRLLKKTASSPGAR